MPLNFVRLEDRILYSATPVATVDAPAEVKVGETVQVSVTFDNTSPTDTGYGAWVDVFIDTTGTDGIVDPADPGNPHAGDTNGVADPGDKYDGLTFSTAPTYLGTPVSNITLTLDDAANGGLGVLHPYAVDSTGGSVYVSTTNPLSPYYSTLNGSYTSGDQMLVMELPFGSFTPDQPTVKIDFGLDISDHADLGAPLKITSLAGFRFGNDVANNPATDPSIIGVADAATTQLGVSLATLTKTYDGPENETATGPNYLRTYRIHVDISDGQTLGELHLFDDLNPKVQFVGITGSSQAYTINQTPSTTASGGTLEVQFTGPVVGQAGGDDAWIDVQFYIPRLYDSDGNGVNDSPVLSPNSGADTLIDNQAYGVGTWVPVDPRDTSSVFGLNVDGSFDDTSLATALATASPDGPPEHEDLEASPLVMQKHHTTVVDSGAAGNTPGDILEYTLDFQISDYFGFDDVVVTDKMLDGLHFDATFTPTLQINGNTFVLGATGWTLANYTVLQNFTGAVASGNLTLDPAVDDGSTTLSFRVSDELVTKGLSNGEILGGGINPSSPNTPIFNGLIGYNDGATTGRITYRAVIQESFTDDFPSGEPAMNPGNVLSNTANIAGNVIDLTSGTALTPYPGPVSSTDDTSSSITIVSNPVVKSVYAVNGDTDLSHFMDPQGRINLQPGDVVTYRVTYTSPTGDVERPEITDFFPSPIFDINDANDDGVFGGISEWVFVDNTGDLSVSDFTPGRITYGPTHSLHTVTTPAANTPALSIDPATNSIKIEWSSAFINTTNTPEKLDVLLSITVNNDPFVDGLSLTNVVQTPSGNTQDPDSEGVTDSIVQIVINEPYVTVYKGVVASTQGGSVGTVGGLTFDPVGGGGFTGILTGESNAEAIGDLNLDASTEVDGGDLVRFALVAMNSGRSDAFDVRVQDTLLGSYVNNYANAAAFAAGTNFQVHRGDGTLLTPGVDYTLTWDNSTKTFVVELTDNYTSGNVGSDVRSGGLSRGFRADSGADIAQGSNAMVVLYDLTVDADAQASSTITNTALLTNYAGEEGAADFTTEDKKEDASVVIAAPDFTKALTGTEITGTGNNAANQAVIGELVTYTLTITVPEGTTANTQIVDTLAPGLAFVSITSVTASSGVTVTGLPGVGNNPANVTVGDNPAGGAGNQLTFHLGDITDANTNNAVGETITIVYQAVVVNTNSVPASPGNQAGASLGNSADFSYTWNDDPVNPDPPAPDGAVTITKASANVIVVEPALAIDKQASEFNIFYSDTLDTIDAGDSVYYRIRITNAAGGPTAYDLVLYDLLPSNLENLTVFSTTLTDAGGGAGGTIAVTDGGSNTLSLDDFAFTGSTLALAAGRNIDLGANSRLEIIVRSTLDFGVVVDQQIINTASVSWSSLDGEPGVISTHHPDSTERTGADGPGADGAVLNNYSVSDSTGVSIAGAVITKTIVRTSEDFTGLVAGIERVAVGEIVRYRLQVRIPEGTFPDRQLGDILPAGMVFINDGTATVGFVSDGNNISSSIGGIGNAPNIGPVVTSPTFVLPGSSISTSVSADNDDYGSGREVRFKLGTITNTESDLGNEYIIIEFNALVLNTTGNQSGVTLANYASTFINGTTPLGEPSSLDVIVAEANLAVAKTASTMGPVDAGDTFSYTITIANNASGDNAAPAFNIRVLDEVDKIISVTNPTLDLEYLSYSLTAPGYTTTLIDASSTATDTLDLTFNRLNAGDSIVITVNVQVKTGAIAGAEIENKAVVTYTSLPGTSGTEDGTIAAIYGTTDVDLNPGVDSVLANADANNGVINLGLDASERTGADSEATADDNTPPGNNGVRNNYAVAAHAPTGLTIQAPTIDKSFKDGSITADDTSSSFTSGANVVIGETVTYDILVTLGEGVTKDLRVQDLVPTGLRVDSYTIITDGSASLAPVAFNGSFSTVPAPAVPVPGASTLTFDFDDVTVVTDNDATNNSFVIRVVATVTNILANQEGGTLTNTAQLLFNDPDGSGNAGPAADRTITDVNAGNDPKVTIVEPQLTITKTVDAVAADAGDPITYTITITNSSAYFAYDVDLTDTLNALISSPVILNGVGDFSATGFTNAPTVADFEITGGNVLQSTPGSNIDMDPGAIIVIKVQGVLSNSVSSGQDITNTATATFTSLDDDQVDGSDGDERTGADGAGGALDDYAVTSPAASTEVNHPTILKALASTDQAHTPGSEVTIGEQITYTLTVTLAEGLSQNFSILDIAQDNANGALEILSASITSMGANLSNTAGLMVGDFGILSSPGTSALNNQAAFTFGDVTNLFDNITNTNDQIVITVIARVTNATENQSGDILSNIGRVTYGPGAATTLDSGSVDVEVVEPRVTIDKTAAPVSNLNAGDVVTYTVVLDNLSANGATTDAFDVSLSDTVPSGILITGIVSTTATGGATVDNVVAITGGGTGLTGQFDIPLGGSITIVYSATIQTSILPGQALVNDADATFTSLNGTNAGERTGADITEPTDNTSPTDNAIRNNYGVGDAVTVTAADYAPLVSKSIVSTSEAGSTGNDLLIGEIVRYQLKVELFEGTLNDLVIQDILPAGLQFLNDGTATLSFIGNTNVITNTTFLTRDSVSGSGTVFTDGTDVFFQLGKVVNNDNDADVEYAVIQFNALVLNTVSNQNGITRDNNFAVLYDADNNSGTAPTAISALRVDANDDGAPETAGQSVSNVVTVTVREAALAFNQTIPAGTGYDAGDTFTITYTITNSGLVPAYNVRLADLVLPAEFDLTAITFTNTGIGGTVTDSTNLGTDSIDAEISQIDAGATWTVSATVTLRDTVNPSDVYTNPADVSFTSLPGANGTGSATPGAAGSATGERTGADGVGGALNDYALTDTEELSIPNPFIVDKVANVSTATIGDIVTYTVTVTVIEGTTTNMVLNDTLPPGMAFVANSATITNANGMTISGFNTNSLDQALTSVLNPGASDSTATAAAGAFTYTYQARVLDVASNDGITAAGDGDGQTVLINDLDASAEGVMLDNDNQATVTVVEPKVIITKVNDDVDKIVSPGQIITYTLTLDNLAAYGSTATAYDIRVRDLLPPTLTLTVGSISVSGTTLTSNSSSGNTLDLTLDSLTLGSSATVTFTATVNMNVTGGATIDNNARIFYDSQAADEGSVPGTGNTVFGEGDGISGDRDYGSTGPVEAHDNNIPDEQDTDRVTVGTGVISDLVWFDLDADGVKDATETGIAGVRVWLDYNNDGIFDANEATAISDANGLYSIGNLAAGNYTVRVLTSTLPDAATTVPTYDLDGPGTPNVSTVALANGQVRMDVDFGYRGTSSIGDLVWHDIDGNGAQNVSELGIMGVTIDLVWDVNGNGLIDGTDSIISTATTDASGNYLFSNLLSGNYIVNVTDTANLLANTTLTGATGVTDPEPVNLSVGEIHLTADFGYQGAASLGDRVWNDRDADGVQESGEFGITGLTVELYRDLNGDGDATDPGEGLVATATTGIDGTYLFSNLISGTYYAVITNPPTAATPTYDLDGTGTPHRAARTLLGNTVATDVDFGYQGSASIGDYVWFDANSDGVQDFIFIEPPIPGVRVYLDINGNGIYESLTEPSATADANGAYSITGLVGGSYTARVDISTLPPGSVATYDLDGNSSPDFTTFVLGSTEIKTDVDWGYFGNLTISGRSYHDLDKNGSFDGADTGLGGVTIDLIHDANHNGAVDFGELPIFTTITAADGTYSFDHVVIADILIRERQLDGYGSSEAPTNVISIFNPGLQLTGNDFGNTTGSIAGHVYLDMNDDGLVDPDGLDDIPGNEDDEISLEGVSVTLTWSGADNVFGNGDDRTVTILTDANGDYLFDYTNTAGFVANGDSTRGLLSTGSYRITETQPDDHLDGADAAGDATIAAGTVTPGTGLLGHGADEITDIQIGISQDAAGYNFGELLPSSISGSVHEDFNGNGIREPFEPGIAGSTIMLTGKDIYGRTVSLTTTSDANGNFRFEDLYASDPTGYTLTQLVQPPGFNDGLEGAGTAGGFAGVEFISTIVLGYNEDATDYTFGEVRILPPVNPKPKPKPEPNPEPEPSILDTYFYNYFENFLPYGTDDDEEDLDYLLTPPSEGIEPMLPIMPTYSGHAEPGSTIVVEIRNARGAIIGMETVMADAGGNWLAKLAGIVVYDIPTKVSYTVTRPTYAEGSENAFNMRTFFSPAINPSHFFTENYDINTVLSEEAGKRMAVMQKANEGSQSFDWDSFNYEFLAEPGVPSS